MSFSSPKEQQSAEAARSQSQYASRLADLSLPQLSNILGKVTGDLSASGIAPSVQSAFGTARTGIQSDYDTAGRSQTAAINQGFAQAGGIYNTNQQADAQKMAALGLDQERQSAMRNLDFQEAQAGLGQYNQLLNLLGGGAGTAMSLGGGFGASQAGAISQMSGQSQGYGTLSGAVAGAGTGAAFGPYGALAGGLLGGALGYFGSGG